MNPKAWSVIKFIAKSLFLLGIMLNYGERVSSVIFLKVAIVATEFTCNPGTWELEAGGASQLCGWFGANLV